MTMSSSGATVGAESRLAVIVGAGIGGLATAVALKQAGWSVRIFERAAHPRELGFALLLAPNAVVSLQQLGLAERVIAEGSEMSAGEIYASGGRLLRRFDLRQIRHLLPQPAIVVLRPALYAVLLDAVGLHNVSLGSEARVFSIQDGKPVLIFANGERTEGTVLIGADGIGSVIRRLLHPDEPPARRSGLWAVRGVAHDVEPPMAGLGGAQYFGRGVEAGMASAGRNAVYWYISLRANHIRDSHDARTIARRCADEFDDRFRTIVSATKPENLRLDELLDRDPITVWGRGPVTLLGDAAHPMLPHAGQGAAQALEDAVAIGRVLHGCVDVELALRRYEQLRTRRTSRIMSVARRNARIGSISTAIGQRLRDFAIRTMPGSVFTKTYIEFGNPPPPQ
jgi:2-polyprenyl-6-methoxyphenol hydroxylase-like FAD-dependent oxidoreductase